MMSVFFLLGDLDIMSVEWTVSVASLVINRSSRLTIVGVVSPIGLPRLHIVLNLFFGRDFMSCKSGNK